METPEEQLLDIFRSLPAGERQTLLDFAEFLGTRSGAAPVPPAGKSLPVPEPEDIERPDRESVVAGLKRLSRTYPMLDKSEMLSATSDVVATHIMQGTDAAVVIDELEAIFETHYRQLKSGQCD
ncbi:MAG: Crp/Fnr family transcriptional regulator [Gammaproteobacteria bacterium]|jgi:hypothetical protein